MSGSGEGIGGQAFLSIPVPSFCEPGERRGAMKRGHERKPWEREPVM